MIFDELPTESKALDRAEISAVLTQVIVAKETGRHRDACAHAVRLVGLLDCAGILDDEFICRAVTVKYRQQRQRRRA